MEDKGACLLYNKYCLMSNDYHLLKIHGRNIRGIPLVELSRLHQ